MNKFVKCSDVNTIKSSVFNVILIISLALILAIYLINFKLYPKIFTNEAVYFVKAIQWSNPSLFINDWTLNLPNYFGVLFTVYIFPFFNFINDPIFAAQLIRITLWVFLIFSIINLANAMHINVKASLLGILLFLVLQHGGLMAGAWLFGGAEQKVIAYGLSFLALSAMLNQKYKLCGALSGSAFFIHVIVGGWSAIAFGLIMLAHGRKKFIDYAQFSIPLALITLAVVFSGMIASNVTVFDGLNVAKSLVEFRNPHHLDPFYFNDTQNNLLMLGCFALLTYNYFFASTSQKIKKASLYLLIMGVFLILGYAARTFDYFNFLNLYPFRLASIYWPLMCSIFLSNSILNLLNSARLKLKKELFINFVILIIIFMIFFIPDLRTLYWDISRVSNSSGTYYGETKVNFNTWIKNNTPVDSTLLVHPCRDNFWLSAERAMVVNFKSAPVNTNYNEWYRRMLTLNGSQMFTSKGIKACTELSQNYNKLTKEQLKNIQKLYNTHYYVVNLKRTDLDSCLVYHEDNDFIYYLPECDKPLVSE